MRNDMSRLALMVGLFVAGVALFVAGLVIALGVRSAIAGSDSGAVALQPSAAHRSNAASGISVTVDPPAPTESDYITITVAGELPYPCFRLSSSHTVSGNVVHVTVEAVEDIPPGTFCVQWVTPFGITEEIGQLPAGLYTARTTFTNLSYDPCHSSPCVKVTTFDVQKALQPTPSPTPTPTPSPTPTPTATPPAAVGGIVELSSGASAPSAQQAGSAPPPLVALAGAAAAVLALTAGAWYARRRRVR